MINFSKNTGPDKPIITLILYLNFDILYKNGPLGFLALSSHLIFVSIIQPTCRGFRLSPWGVNCGAAAAIGRAPVDSMAKGDANAGDASGSDICDGTWSVIRP